MWFITETSKQIVLLELTVPWQECIEDTPDWKKAKYSELVEDSSSTGGERGVSHWVFLQGLYHPEHHRQTKSYHGGHWGNRGCLKVAVDKERGTIGWVALPGHKLGLDKPQLVQLGQSA